MTELLTFMMGEYAAEIPVDRYYAKNHMWAQSSEAGSDLDSELTRFACCRTSTFWTGHLTHPPCLSRGK